jgi:DNA-binding transcriptional LysR family regulator
MLNRISLRQMEYFVATAECGSIITASDRIHVSSPSISAAIAHIESELGVQLFVRHHAKGLTLTPTGTRMMVECQHILTQMHDLYTVANESVSTMRGPLRIGCLQSLAPMVAPEVIYGFQQVSPAIRLSHIEAHQTHLMEKLRSMDIDLALTLDLHVTDGIAFEALAQLPPHVIVGEHHPLASHTCVTLEELASLPMVLFDTPLHHTYVTALFINAGLLPNIARTSTSHEVVRTMVANHMGYALINASPNSPCALDGKRLVHLRLNGTHRPLQLGVATYQAVQHSQLVSAFMTHCRATVSDTHIPGIHTGAASPASNNWRGTEDVGVNALQ